MTTVRYFVKHGLLGVLLAAAFACGRSEQPAGTTADSVVVADTATPVALEPLDSAEWEIEDPLAKLSMPERVKLFADSLRSLKEQAFASEQTKLQDAERMLQQLEQTGAKVPAKAVQQVRQAIADTRKALYDEETMSNEKAMDAYDAATAKLVQSMKDLREKMPDFERYRTAVLYYESVLKADGRDFHLRKDYNQYAEQLNAMLDTSGTEVRRILRTELRKVKQFYGDSVTVN